MQSASSLNNVLEDINARVLATDPADAVALAHVVEDLAEILKTLEPDCETAEVLNLGLCGLQCAERVDQAQVLDALAAAIAASSRRAENEAPGGMAALDSAAAALRELLASQGTGLAPQAEPGPQRSVCSAATAELGQATSAEVETAPWNSDKELVNEFVAEASDRIAAAEAAILALESNPDDNEAVHTVLRAFHTIKGVAGFLELAAIQSLAHHAENLLIRGRDGEIRITGSHADLALECCDTLKLLIDGLKSGAPGREMVVPDNLPALIAALSEHAPESGRPQELPQGSEGSAGSRRAEAHPTAATADRPPLEPAAVRNAIEERNVAEGVPFSHDTAQSDGSVRVSTQRLDSLLDLVGELVIAQSIVARDARIASGGAPGTLAPGHARVTQSVSHAGKIVRQLQDLAMSLRMVPLSRTFHKLGRLARDVSQKSGKLIHFHSSGEETEIDRTMVESLSDPLLHMIRNAVDHGIEAAAERVARGKPPAGSLRLRAYHSAGSVVIELEDDGRGLDRDKILRKAVQQGLLESDRTPSDDEIDFLIFHPGLSTAEKVTDVSGRGVGLDVVKRNIEALHGRIELDWRPGAGTKFTLRLPLTMAIMDAMLLRVGCEQYLLPTVVIQRSFRPAREAVSTMAGREEFVRHHDRLYPLVRLGELFAIPEAVVEPERAMLVLIEGGAKSCALMVDELLGQQQVVIKSLGSRLANARGVSGAAILGDGRVGLILDAVGLLQIARRQARQARCDTNLKSEATAAIPNAPPPIRSRP